MTPSSFIPPLPIRVFNSNSLSTITSVGIHALVLLLILPRVASLSANDPEKGTRNVNLIELSPAEQSRLPDASPSSSAIPELANSPLGNIPLVDSPIQQTAVPNYLNNLPAPPALPALPALPPLYGNSNIGGLPIATPPPSLSIPRNFTPRSLPIPPQAQTPALPGVEIARSPQRPDFPPLKPPVPIDDLINGRNGDPSQPQPIAANTPSNPNWANNRDTIAPSDDRITRLVAATLQGADNLRYNGNNTSDQEAQQNDLDWMKKTGELLKRNQNVTIQGTYPRAACGLQLKGAPVYNVVVDGQGNLAQPPFLTRSSGYGILNNQGLQEVRSRGFSQSTRVTVVFNPDASVCPQMARGTQTPELPGTQTPANQENPPVTPPSEARRNPPEPSSVQEKTPVPVTPSEARRNPPETPKPQEKAPVTPPPEARRNPPEIPKPQEKAPVTPPPEARRNPPELPPVQETSPIVEPTPEARRNVPEPLPPVEPPANIPPAPASGKKAPEESVIYDNGALGNPLPRKDE